MKCERHLRCKKVFCSGILLLSSACTPDFFVDRGHIDVVRGVPFNIMPPHLFIKKAFKLRADNLTPAQLEKISDAMPFIASLTSALLSASPKKLADPSLWPLLRNIRNIQALDDSTPMHVKAIQHWQVTERTIEFTIDYVFTKPSQNTVVFRDNYRMAQTQNAWVFSGHPRPKPEGELQCVKGPLAWMACDVPLPRR